VYEWGLLWLHKTAAIISCILIKTSTANLFVCVSFVFIALEAKFLRDVVEYLLDGVVV